MIVTLNLQDGSGYTFSEHGLKKITYEEMKVFQYLDIQAFTYTNIKQYWIDLSLNPKKKSRIFFFIFSSLIPILALFIIASFSIINPRYQRNYAYIVLTITTIALYSIATLLERHGTINIFIITISFVFTFGYFLFKRLILRFF
jgi:hypothetical protein